MRIDVLSGILIPFLGTALGAAAVFLFRDPLHPKIKKSFFGFSAGVMQAAAVWSLLLPALDAGGAFPAVAGLLSGFLLFLLGDLFLESKRKKLAISQDRGRLLAWAVTLHNIPEGMAVGVAFAGAIQGTGTIAAAMVLSLGIALQNFPEGAVISMPLAAMGVKKGKAFSRGALSGAVEPLGAIAALALTSVIVPVLPFVLSFAAGAMLYVVAVELIPALSGGSGEQAGQCSFILGFSLMMLLDVILG